MRTSHLRGGGIDPISPVVGLSAPVGLTPVVGLSPPVLAAVRIRDRRPLAAGDLRPAVLVGRIRTAGVAGIGKVGGMGSEGSGVLRLGTRSFGPGEFALMAIVNRTP